MTNEKQSSRLVGKEGDSSSPDVYGEPNGPTPPHFEIKPKAEIDANRGKPVAHKKPTPVERDRGGFHSGMTTEETAETVGGPKRNNR
jgi:hypothetical protein